MALRGPLTRPGQVDRLGQNQNIKGRGRDIATTRPEPRDEAKKGGVKVPVLGGRVSGGRINGNGQ